MSLPVVKYYILWVTTEDPKEPGFFGDEYNYMASITKNVSFTITKGQENTIYGVPYHHRPLSVYFNKLVESGFAIDGFDETYPNKYIQEKYGAR